MDMAINSELTGLLYLLLVGYIIFNEIRTNNAIQKINRVKILVYLKVVVTRCSGYNLFDFKQMAKAKIIIASANDEFTSKQIQFMKRMVLCLIQHHGLSATAIIKETKVKTLKIKVA